jgi:hypothetical protein
MKRLVLFSLVILSASSLQAAKYAGEFLYLGAGGRPLSLGGAYVAESGDVLSGYYNPAGLSILSHSQAIFMHSETFGSLLNHDFLAYARPVGSGETKTAIGISLYRLGGGGIIVTSQDQTGRFYKIKEESHADYAAYFSYGRQLGKRLLAGISTKVIFRDIVDETAFGLGLDVGGIYSISSWADIGLNIQDATTTLLSYTTGTKESINPTAKIGARIHGTRGRISAAVFSDADLRFEGRDYAAQLSAGAASLDSHLGIEISYLEKIAARIGSDVGNMSLGAGLRFGRINIDLALKDHSDLGFTYLASLMAGF